MDLRSAQNAAWENKLAKGFNTTDIPLEFCLLNGEIAEAFDAWRKAPQDVAEELADAAIFLLGLAEMTGVDLQDAIKAKLAKNATRVYQRLPNGVLVKSGAVGGILRAAEPVGSESFPAGPRDVRPIGSRPRRQTECRVDGQGQAGPR